MLARFGTALVFIGLIVLVVFLITFSAGTADLRTLLAGAGLAVAGLVLRRRGLPAVQESSRFVTMRRVMKRKQDLGEEEEEGSPRL
jgi:cytochrome c biogenesis protein CcdA